MSRPMMQRSLTLTEELERLEQSITLTLQEIDSNFSKAHRIVTTSILPIVEQYAKHSNDVWEGSKFWKQFFEASANVSLSGYEEANEEEVTQTDTSDSLHTPTDRDDSTITGTRNHPQEEEDFSVDSPTQITGLQTTPRLPPSALKAAQGGRAQTSKSSTAHRSPSPRKYTGTNPRALDTSSDQPSTPRAHMAAMDFQSSPFQPESAVQPSAFHTRNTAAAANNDPLMHRVLDKNYRIQATPHTQHRTHARPPPSAQPTPATATRKLWEDSPGSSPELAAPQLRHELFSPAKGEGGRHNNKARRTSGAAAAAPRTPGVSVLTPAYHRQTEAAAARTTSTGRRLFSPQDKTYASTKDRTRRSHVFDDSDDDGDEDDDDSSTDAFGGMSPPKTMQFHVPQSRLVQTPAREASRRIVEDLLLTAGAEATDEIEQEDDDDGGYDLGEMSPSVVRRAMDDDTF